MSGFLPFFNSEGGPPTGAAGGDLGGSYPNPTVINIEGHPVSAVAPTAGQLLIENSGATSAVWTTLSGDVTASTSTVGQITVAKINGTTVSTAGGALTTGKVLRVTGASTVDYGAVDLANTNAVTGTLPNTNQAAQSMGGDVSGTTASATVAKIQGNTFTSGSPTKGQFVVATTTSNYGPVTLSGDISESATTAGLLTVVSISGASPIAITPANLQWIVGASSPTINQVSTSSGSGTTLTVQAQGATGASNNGGNLNLSSGTSGSATVGTLNLQAGGTTTASVVPNKFVFNQGRRRNITATTASPYNVLATDDIIAVGAIGAGITVNLPNAPTTGDSYDIKDTVGTAATKNITVAGNGHNIDGASTFVINTNYGSTTVTFSGSVWSVL